MARVISIVNQKGGVGKTTTAINLSTALAISGKRVLLIDLDSQGNASTGLGVEDRKNIVGTYDLLLQTPDMDSAILQTEVENLWICPATDDLSSIDIELRDIKDREYKLKQSLKKFSDDFDYIFLDCPPGLGLITLNGLTASSDVIVPLQAEFYALEGLSQLIDTVKRVKLKFNPELKIEGIVLTMYNKQHNLSSQVENEVRTHLADLVYKTIIPRNVRIAEAPSHGLPVILYDSFCNGSISYVNLAKELIEREKRETK